MRIKDAKPPRLLRFVQEIIAGLDCGACIVKGNCADLKLESISRKGLSDAQCGHNRGGQYALSD
jgi:hypothetical protein